MIVARSVCIAALIATAAPASADAGELYVDMLELMPEIAWLSNPAAHDAMASPFDPSATFTFLPRVGAGARYGLTNILHVGLSADAAAFANLINKGVTIDGRKGDLYTGTYLELSAPLSLGWRIDSGFDLTGVVELQAGPMLTLWAANALADPKNLDGSGLPSTLPVDVEDRWTLGVTSRLLVAFEARLFDLFVIALSPYIGASWAGTPAFHLGFFIRPSLAFGVGPL